MQTTTIAVDGLMEPVEIVIDRWGIPHIRAKNLDDMFFGQGFNAARDRLWQIDLWRKRGLGLLAADFGPGYVAQDTASRLFLYRGDMAAEWASYGDDAESICESFTSGINAYINLLGTNADWLPPEFTRMGTIPAKWAPEDVVRIRVHSWMRNAMSEVVRANVMANSSAEADLLRQNLDPMRVPVAAEGLDLAEIPLDALDVLTLALAPVTFSDRRLSATESDIDAWAKVPALDDIVRDGNGQGSNNWVIGGQLTETGRPILANDPHRAHAVPPLRYLVHLSSPEFDGIGAGEPVIPGFTLGHNGQIAFGLTLFFGSDSEDVYVYETSPENSGRYRYGDGWEDIRVVTETIPVKGAPDRTVKLKFTRHGPVVKEDVLTKRAFAVRSTWFEPGSAPYFASITAMRAKNYAEFRKEMRRWAVPSLNMVFADAGGDISWMAVGKCPVRRNWDGLLPVPGDGRFEWDGFYNSEDFPHVVNPAAGFFATANEMNLPGDWPHEEKQIGFEWYDRSRATRIAEAFAEAKSHNVQSSCALQTDALSMPARRVQRLLPSLQVEESDTKWALQTLLAWNCVTSAESAAAAIFEVWWSKHLRPGMLALATPDPAIQLLLAPGDPDSVIRELENPGVFFGDNPEVARDALLLDSLADALRECRERMGHDMTAWAWGRLHHGYFEHDLNFGRKNTQPGWDVGPLPMGGSESTTMNTMYRYDDFRVVLGASARLVIDVGSWDNSMCVNTPGQSGDPRSEHYSDLAPLWAKGEYVPLLYSRAGVDRVATRKILLAPRERCD